MTASVRWTLAVLLLVAVLGIALAAELRRQDARAPAGAQPARDHRDADTPEALAGPRQRAGLLPCPAPLGGPGASDAGSESLRGIVVECAADGSQVNVAPALAGRTVILNFWAYWCAPCAQELPALADYQRSAGDAVTVLTVHQDENETAALLRLAELDVRLPTLQDGRRRIAAALQIPNVMPATVILRRDGSVAAVLPRPFTDTEQIAAAVAQALDSRVAPR